MIADLVKKNRSYRRFNQDVEIPTHVLREFVNLARLSASGRNMQPLKYILSNENIKNEKIFSTLMWAGYLPQWDGPQQGERPSGYLIQLLDKRLASHCFCDDGIAAQSILLAAVEKGLGGCIFRSIDKQKLHNLLSIPSHFEIINVIALGKPVEEVVIDQMINNDHKYWRDENGVHHVPKRSLSEIILNL